MASLKVPSNTRLIAFTTPKKHQMFGNPLLLSDHLRPHLGGIRLGCKTQDPEKLSDILQQ